MIRVRPFQSSCYQDENCECKLDSLPQASTCRVFCPSQETPHASWIISQSPVIFEATNRFWHQGIKVPQMASLIPQPEPNISRKVSAPVLQSSHDHHDLRDVFSGSHFPEGCFVWPSQDLFCTVCFQRKSLKLRLKGWITPTCTFGGKMEALRKTLGVINFCFPAPR